LAFNLRAAFAAAIGSEQVSADKAMSEIASGKQPERALLVVANQGRSSPRHPPPEQPLGVCLSVKNGSTGRNWAVMKSRRSTVGVGPCRFRSTPKSWHLKAIDGFRLRSPHPALTGRTRRRT